MNVVDPSITGWSAALDFNAPFARETSRVKRGAFIPRGSFIPHNAAKQQRSRNQSTSDVSLGQAIGNTVGGRRSFQTAPADDDRVRTFSGNMDVSGISQTGRIWTFSPNSESLRPENLQDGQKVLLMAIWDGISKEEIEIAKNATVLYFDSPVKDASCLVDRF